MYTVSAVSASGASTPGGGWEWRKKSSTCAGMRYPVRNTFYHCTNQQELESICNLTCPGSTKRTYSHSRETSSSHLQQPLHVQTSVLESSKVVNVPLGYHEIVTRPMPLPPTPNSFLAAELYTSSTL